MASLMKLACLVVMCIAVVGAPIVQAITCGQVTSNIVPCLNYLQNGGTVPPACCNGVRSIANAARTTPDRRAACNCLKSAAARTPRLNPNNAQSLPGICRVNIPYKISISTNCDSIR